MGPLLLLARRFISNTKEKTLITMMIMCFISIATGSCALALIAAIMNGFEKKTHEVIQGIHPDIIITSGGKALNYTKIRDLITKEHAETLLGISPSSQGHVLIKIPQDDTISALAMLIGIDPQAEPSTSKLPSLIIQSLNEGLPFGDLLKENHILLGQQLADFLAIRPGDSLTFLFAPEQEAATSNLSLEQRPVTLGGTFKTGINDIDSHVIFCNLPLFDSMFPDQGVTQIGLKVRPGSQEHVIKNLQKKLSLSITSWKDLYPALLSALTLQKYGMFLTFALITLVASINIISLLFMYITHKKTDIAVLKTLGFTGRDIMKLFILIGVGLAGIASAVGIALASVASYSLNNYSLIKLPDVYYVSHLPSHMSMSIVLAVWGIVLIISLFASLIPARHISKLTTADLLRQTL